MAQVNCEGLTFDEWCAAANFGRSQEDKHDVATMRRAWRAGEDPTEYAAAPSLSRRNTRINSFTSGRKAKVNTQGLTFKEWSARAGWSEAASRLTGEGMEEPELSWQMGTDPEEELADNNQSAQQLSEMLMPGQKIPGPGLSAHTAWNAVHPPLDQDDTRRFASLASMFQLTPAQFAELRELYKKSGQFIPRTSHGGSFDEYLARYGGRINALSTYSSTDAIVAERAAEQPNRTPAVALGLLGLAVLGGAVYYASLKPAAGAPPAPKPGAPPPPVPVKPPVVTPPPMKPQGPGYVPQVAPVAAPPPAYTAVAEHSRGMDIHQTGTSDPEA